MTYRAWLVVAFTAVNTADQRLPQVGKTSVVCGRVVTYADAEKTIKNGVACASMFTSLTGTRGSTSWFLRARWQTFLSRQRIRTFCRTSA